MTVQGWRAWYVGGQVYEGTTFAQWHDLPADGVLVVMLYYDRDAAQGRPLRLSLSGDDYYWQTPAAVFGSSKDAQEQIKLRYPGASLKRGKWGTLDAMDAASAASRDSHERPV